GVSLPSIFRSTSSARSPALAAGDPAVTPLSTIPAPCCSVSGIEPNQAPYPGVTTAGGFAAESGRAWAAAGAASARESTTSIEQRIRTSWQSDPYILISPTLHADAVSPRLFALIPAAVAINLVIGRVVAELSL